MENISLNCDEMVFHFIDTYTRLINTIRYNTTPKIVSENVASHSFFVAYITMMLCDKLESKVDKSKAISMALIHDIEESISSDIIYSIKHNNQEFSDALEKLNEIIVQKIYIKDKKYLSPWKEYKEGITLESRIVEIADRMSSILYVLNEIKMGNKSVLPIFQNNIELVEKEGIPEIIPFIWAFKVFLKDVME